MAPGRIRGTAPRRRPRDPEPAITPAPALEVAGLAKSYGEAPVLSDLALAVAPGAVAALLGPSGCGKTTLLRLVAGFERPDAGTVSLAGRPVAGGGAAWVPPHRRAVGYVPQDGALFPHLDAAGNVGFGLSAAGRRSGRVEAMLALVGLEGLGRRMPHELSGGQQRRVAIARALAPEPALVLLDEPFNGLDAPLRRALCADVRAILRRGGAAALMVTHDRDEAFSVADEIAAMRCGRVVQRGTPADFYRSPVDLDTARLAGAALRLDGRLAGAAADTPLGRLPVRNPHGVADGPVALMLRPEQIVPRAGGTAAIVRHAAMLGPLTWVDLVAGGVALQACWLASAPTAVGAEVCVGVEGDALAFPPGEG